MSHNRYWERDRIGLVCLTCPIAECVYVDQSLPEELCQLYIPDEVEPPAEHRRGQGSVERYHFLQRLRRAANILNAHGQMTHQEFSEAVGIHRSASYNWNRDGYLQRKKEGKQIYIVGINFPSYA